MSTKTVEMNVGDVGARGADASAQVDGQKMALNVGPSHPTTHGVLRLMMDLDGDVITRCEPVLGYLHRGDEKIAENMTYNQFVPYTDRLDYLSPLANNVAYAIAVERVAGIELPERCEAIRVLVCDDGQNFEPSFRHGSFWNGCRCMDSIHVYFHRKRETLHTFRGTHWS